MSGFASIFLPLALAGQVLELSAVLESTRNYYPKIYAAEQKVEEARGKLLANRGVFDLKLSAVGKRDVLGFYDKLDAEISVQQGLSFGGIDVEGGVRYGEDFAPYDGAQYTSDRGEGFLRAVIPLWKNRGIDERRLGVRLAEVAIELRSLDLSLTELNVFGKATTTYWKWVGAGRKLSIAKRLLELAETRQNGIQRQVEQGSSPEILLRDNMRLIVSRRVLLVQAERDLQQSALALSLFNRDPRGEPLVPLAGQLPERFPDPASADQMALQEHLTTLTSTRPDLRLFNGLLAQVGIEQQFASNLGAPTFDVLLKASQDAGDQVFYGMDSNEKTINETEVGVGLKFSLPVQRRKGRGETIRTTAAMRRVQAEFSLAAQEASAQLRQAHLQLDAASRQVGYAREAYELALQLEAAERRKFELGQSNLLFVNQRESTSANDAEKLISSLQAYQNALALYRIARGVWD